MLKKEGEEGKVYMALIIFSVEIGGRDCAQELCNMFIGCGGNLGLR